MKKSLASQLAEFVCDLSFDRIPEELIYKAKIYLLDWLGSVYAGSSEVPTKISIDIVLSIGGNPEATVIPNDFKTSCIMASLVNGASSHVVEMDDLHRESIFHPAAAILPAVFATAEREKVSGKELILGIIAGYEVGIRIALAVGKSHYHFWHTTATCGTFGAAAGAGKLLGLNPEQMTWALGSAGTQAAGLWEFLYEGAMSKQLHTGKASMNGLLASLLAQKGFTGASRILEGDKGFFRATSKDFSTKRVTEKLGEEFVSSRNSLKYYASCGHTHSAIDATLKALDYKPVEPKTVRSVKVTTYQEALDLLKDVKPESPYAAKFNLPFCVATAIKYGHVNPSDFSSVRLKDSDLWFIMERTTLLSDPELTAQYPSKWPARVEIFLEDGTLLTGFNEYPKGDPENPLTEEECIAKFHYLADPVLPSSRLTQIQENILILEKIKDVSLILECNNHAS